MYKSIYNSIRISIRFPNSYLMFVSGPSGIIDGGKKKVLLLKGKEKDISHVSNPS